MSGGNCYTYIANLVILKATINTSAINTNTEGKADGSAELTRWRYQVKLTLHVRPPSKSLLRVTVLWQKSRLEI